MFPRHEGEMNLWEVLEEAEDKNFSNWRLVNYLLWKKVLLLHCGDFWLMTFFLGMWDPYLWQGFRDSDDDEALSVL